MFGRQSTTAYDARLAVSPRTAGRRYFAVRFFALSAPSVLSMTLPRSSYANAVASLFQRAATRRSDGFTSVSGFAPGASDSLNTAKSLPPLLSYVVFFGVAVE